MPDQPSFEPILLNLADDDDYAILVNVLGEYEQSLTGLADDEDERIRYNKLPEAGSEAPYWRAQAARVRVLIDDIERQLDANSAARRSTT